MTGDPELREEERRYREAAGREARTLDSRVLKEPLRKLEPRPALAVPADATIAEAAGRMAEAGQGCVVVLEEERLAGTLTERDVMRRVLAPGEDPKTVRVGEAMTREPERLSLDDTLGYALHKMSVGSFRHLPIVDEQDRPVGLVTQQDGVRYLAGFFPEEVLNQPPRSIEQRPPRNRYGG